LTFSIAAELPPPP
jgi:hypothetical protein